MRDQSLHILQHALGLDDYGQRKRYESERRNHYCVGEDAADFALCTAHVDAGLMVRHGPSPLYGGQDSYCFVVTEAGREHVREHSPKPPKVSRARQRYLDWLHSPSMMSFGDWLKNGGGRHA